MFIYIFIFIYVYTGVIIKEILWGLWMDIGARRAPKKIFFGGSVATRKGDFVFSRNVLPKGDFVFSRNVLPKGDFRFIYKIS